MSNEKIGESWNIVDRDEEQSRCEISKANFFLYELIEQRTQELMGPKWKKNKRFPILVKWLDCQERLSLQVHPPEEMAAKLKKGEPKTEAGMWSTLLKMQVSFLDLKVLLNHSFKRH